MNIPQFTRPPVVSRAQWLEARRQLWLKERAATHARDALNAERRKLPLVRIDKDYRFEGPDGPLSLLDLFEGRPQLVVYHFMFHRDKGVGCEGCSFVIDNIPRLEHLHARGTTLAMVSRAPLAEIAPFKARMGWRLPWYSSFGSDFNYDFHVTIDENVAPVEYNYRDKAELERLGQTCHMQGEQPGMSVFLRDGEEVLHSYSTYGRGLEAALTTYHLLDLTPLGRGEGWGGMADLEGKGLEWMRFHDEYGQAAPAHGCCES
ncbi:DUF899 domain-containing protein [Pseudomonas schmalbachii]|uniref:DUF899 domain-containing protein n=1 Tax=Pseudomonas schmalbachii TaxID=2816993 RepID=A0ABS3TVM8_9PSED|nr:DUF899 domain-containing protein [Pseudomonas schmalbachii]MBO3277698.1 DUF899 domain-containing protein [Pseudomonas schmalbachii]